MAFAANRFMLGLLIVALSIDFSDAQIGVAYGRNGDGLPPPSQVVGLYKQYNIQRMRIYDTHKETLEALRGSDIELTVGILNQDLETLDAGAWVRDNILPYHPGVNFKHIVVGNEVRPGKPDTERYVHFVLPAMQKVHNALPAYLRESIKVTTALDNEVIDPESNEPPENGRFRPEIVWYIDPIVRFLVETEGPLFVSIYPYFAYLNSEGIDLGYALLDPNYPGYTTSSGMVYKNLFYALLDTVNAALEKSVDSMSLEVNTDAVNKTLPPKVKGGESGWSGSTGPGALALANTDAAAGDAASVDNARAYVNNLVQAVKNGTPLRPGEPIETYIFAMFDENRKSGNEEEGNFGIFLPNGQPKYQVNFN